MSAELVNRRPISLATVTRFKRFPSRRPIHEMHPRLSGFTPTPAPLHERIKPKLGGFP